MFISNKEAEDRLKDKRNIFREGDSSAPSSVPPSSMGNREARIAELKREADELEALRQRRGKLSEEDSTISLDHLDHLLTPRIKSRPYTNPDVQAAVAETAIVLGASKAGAIFDRDSQQPRRMTNGFTSGRDGDAGIHSPALVSRLTRIKERLAEKAADKLDATMNALTPQKISEIKRATNLSRVAKDMATVMDKCSERKDESAAGVHFHIYRPETVSEQIYETVSVGPSLSVPSSSARVIDVESK